MSSIKKISTGEIVYSEDNLFDIEYGTRVAVQNYGLNLDDVEIVDGNEHVFLDSLKAQRCIEIDNKSVELLKNGFEYDGRKFSLSMEAQINWLGLKAGAEDGVLQFPMTFSTLDECGYTMQSASEVPVFFWGHMAATRESILQSGRMMKAAIMECTTVEQMDAIVDAR